MSRAGRGFFSQAVLGGTVQLFANETKTVLEAMTSLDWREIEGVNIHGIWISSWV